MSAPRPSYHHGDLRNAMVATAVDAARRDGPHAVVVRDIARQVGVSHNAGYRHFASRDDLLSAVARAGLEELAARMVAALETVGAQPDPVARARARLRAIGRAYVGFARQEPGLFRTIWAGSQGAPAIDPDETGTNPYDLLNRALDDCVAAGALPAERRPFSEVAAWSAVHGLSCLLLDGPLAGLTGEQVDEALERTLGVVDSGL